MLLNYIKLTFRLMIRHPFYTFINVAGLSIGFTAFYILWPYSQNELRSDQFHKDYELIARLSRIHTSIENGSAQSFKLPMHNSGIARKFAGEYPEITALTRIVPQDLFETLRHGFDEDVFVSVEKDNGRREFFREYNLVFADSNFFQFFSFPLLRGNPDDVLIEPNTAAISSSHAFKYFGTDDPVNKIIFFNDSIPVTVKGVFKDLPRNTHIKGDVIISTAGIKELNLTGWYDTWWSYCYIKVTKEADFQALEDKINAEKERIYGLCVRCAEGSYTSAYIQPLKTVVFTNLIANTFNSKSEYLLIALSVLALAIPLLACINYLSLSINMFQKRLSEIGIRKVAGADKRHFAMQFAVESFILHVLSLCISFTLIQLVKTPVETLLNFYSLSWNELPSSTTWIIAALFVMGIAVTSVYPLLVSNSKKSVLLMKKTWTYNSPSWINAIVTAQYVAAIVLFICIVCTYLQINFLISKPLGVEKDGVLVIDCPLQQQDDFETKLDYFIKSATAVAGVQGATVSKNVIGDFAGYGIPLQRVRSEAEFGLDINGGVDHNFLDVYRIKLLHGRNFRADMPSDRSAILVSRDATARLGFSSPEQAIGARVILPWYNNDNVEVIGVYEDYQFRPHLLSVLQPQRGSFMSYRNFLIPDLYPSKISVRINSSSLDHGLGELEKVFKQTFPQDVFHWMLLDQNVQKPYLVEKIARNQIGMFTLLAIGIACLGLLGLTSNKVIQKTKEIGIRKVLGARLHHVAQILLKATVRQLVTAVFIGLPLAYYLVQQYLQKFSERIELQWWHFTLPVIVLAAIMLATIASILWKACVSNPVEALKHE